MTFLEACAALLGISSMANLLANKPIVIYYTAWKAIKVVARGINARVFMRKTPRCSGKFERIADHLSWSEREPAFNLMHLHDPNKNPGEVSDLPCTKQGPGSGYSVRARIINGGYDSWGWIQTGTKQLLPLVMNYCEVNGGLGRSWIGHLIFFCSRSWHSPLCSYRGWDLVQPARAQIETLTYTFIFLILLHPLLQQQLTTTNTTHCWHLHSMELC